MVKLYFPHNPQEGEMPKIIIEIEYDKPDDPYWMNPDNLWLCLQKYCPNTKWDVRWAKDGDPWKD